MNSLELNPDARVEIRHVGNERTPVVVIDEVLRSTEPLRLQAVTGSEGFGSDGDHAYPGVRRELPVAYRETLKPYLEKLIAETYRPPAALHSELVHKLFSLVSLPPAELQLLQRMPHFDNHSPFYFATVHYLSEGEHGGTGIFRHRPTGFESINAQRYPIFVREAQTHVQRHGPPALKYINESDDHFELIETLAYRPNRLLLYPGYLLHSGLIRPERDISGDPRTGRLTANLFFNYR